MGAVKVIKSPDDWLRSPVLRAVQAIGFEPRNVSYFAEWVNPMWSLTQLRARVVRVVDEARDTRSFVLEPNAHWAGMKAGQHVGVCVEVGGVLHRRRYSLSCVETGRSGAAARLQITVKRVDGGVVSNYLHDHLADGDVLLLEPVDGEFTLPENAPQKILMLAAGSGVTPLYSQLLTLLSSGYRGDVEFLHYVRSPDDCIFGESLQELAERYSNLSLRWCYTQSGAVDPQRFSAEQLASVVPDYADRKTFLCGPAGFMASVRELWSENGLGGSLSYEYFAAPPVEVGDVTDAVITVEERELALAAGQTLLDALLDGGERPKYGCRRGVCHECKCKKTSGVVKNLLTGSVSSGEESIQLCISVPLSDVSLARSGGWNND